MHAYNLLEPENALIVDLELLKHSKTVNSRHAINIRSNHVQITFESLQVQEF